MIKITVILKLERMRISFARRFVQKPGIYPDESTHAKMFNSGMLTGEKIHNYSVFAPFRIQLVVGAYLKADKKMVSNPMLGDSELIESFIFYYFGERISMNLYKDYIHIVDGNKEHWYHSNEEDSLMIEKVLAAG
jgi:hypothetical protein